MNFTVIEAVEENNKKGKKKRKIKILDQTKLPTELVYNSYDDYRDIINSIKKLEVHLKSRGIFHGDSAQCVSKSSHTITSNWVFDFYDISSHVCKEHRCVWASLPHPQLQNSNSL